MEPKSIRDMIEEVAGEVDNTKKLRNYSKSWNVYTKKYDYYDDAIWGERDDKDEDEPKTISFKVTKNRERKDKKEVKIRTGFVSNSSSSSFVIDDDDEPISKVVEKMKKSTEDHERILELEKRIADLESALRKKKAKENKSAEIIPEPSAPDDGLQVLDDVVKEMEKEGV